MCAVHRKVECVVVSVQESENIMSEDPTRILPNDTNAMFARILAELQSMNARITSLESDGAEIKQKLSALEEKVDRRLQETRPIWEAVLLRLEKLEERMGELEEHMRTFEIELKSVRRSMHRELAAMSSAQEDIEERLDSLEGRNAA